jgi:alpha-N-arabinofuranosidase
MTRVTWLVLLLPAAIAVQPPSRPTPQTSPAVDIDASTVDGKISPLLYGQFIEFMFEGVKYGLHAEMIRDRGFEEAPDSTGLSRYWQRYPDDRVDDYAMSFKRDDGVAYPEVKPSEGTTGGHSMRFELKPGVIAHHGIYQPRVKLRQGLDYHGYIWARTDSFQGAITAALEADTDGGRVYAAERIGNVAGGWTKYSFTLRPDTTDSLARFVVAFEGQGTIWIDQASLMPDDARDGIRPDVFDKVKQLEPAFIRWPGGNVAQDYHWQWGVGPRDARPSWINLSWRNEVESGDLGTGELIRFARSVGAEPSLTVNVEGRGATAEEAAAWVEYCNGPADSTYGAKRAADGHPEPYRVKYWEIGNEIWGDWVRGHSDASTYARNLTRYAAAMRAVDPSIELIAVGDNDMAWNRTVVERGAPTQYLAIHHYVGRRDTKGDTRQLLARPLQYERFYGDVDGYFRQLAPERRPQLAINEWGLDLPESQQYSILSALYAARLMNVFERKSNLVGMSAVSDLVNGWPGGIIQSGRGGVFVTPIYLVNSVYARHRGADRLRTRIGDEHAHGDGDAATLDVVASRSADGRHIFLKIVNLDLDRAAAPQITIRGAQVSPTATAERVVADSLTAVNGFSTPAAIRLTRESIGAGNRFVLDMSPHSVAVVTLDLVK